MKHEEIRAAMTAIQQKQHELSKEHGALRDKYNEAAVARAEELTALRDAKQRELEALSKQIRDLDLEIRKVQATVIR